MSQNKPCGKKKNGLFKKVTVWVLVVLMVLGIFMIFSGELEIGIFTILMAIVLSIPQIVVGIIVRVVTKNKK